MCVRCICGPRDVGDECLDAGADTFLLEHLCD